MDATEGHASNSYACIRHREISAVILDVESSIKVPSFLIWLINIEGSSYCYYIHGNSCHIFYSLWVLTISIYSITESAPGSAGRIVLLMLKEDIVNPTAAF